MEQVGEGKTTTEDSVAASDQAGAFISGFWYINDAQRVFQLKLLQLAATLNHLLRCRTLVSVAHNMSRCTQL
jgi:hypothetical protein